MVDGGILGAIAIPLFAVLLPDHLGRWLSYFMAIMAPNSYGYMTVNPTQGGGTGTTIGAISRAIGYLSPQRSKRRATSEGSL